MDGVCEPTPCPVSSVGDADLVTSVTLRNSSNPFTGTTTLRLSGPPATSARVLIFDAAGRLVRTAWEGNLDGREVAIAWDGKDQSGRETLAGIYLVRVESGAGEAVGRLVKTR
jgi:flagellar hook assembly protein FlgD